MAATRTQIVELARTCLGTRFRHQGRLPQRGLDCVGLIIHLSNSLELSDGPYERTGYAHFPAQYEVQRELACHLERIPLDQAKEGDVLVLADDGNHSCHVGILASARDRPTLIHAAARWRAVIEQNLDRELRRKLRSAYRFRAVIEEVDQ